MHFCADELFLLMSLIPFIGVWFKKLHTWYHTKYGHKCHTKHCDDSHPEHKEDLL